MLITAILIGGLILFGFLMSNGKHNPEYNANKEKEREHVL